MTSVTNTVAAGDTILAALAMQNWNDLASAIDAIDTSNLKTSAGIVSRQIADRYAIVPVVIDVVPQASGTDISAQGYFTFVTSAAFVVAYRDFFLGLSGKENYLVAVHVDVRKRATADPQIKVYVNSNLVGGQLIALSTADNVYRAENANPIQNPLLPLAIGDKIEVQLGAAGTTAQVAGVKVTLYIKTELLS